MKNLRDIFPAVSEDLGAGAISGGGGGDLSTGAIQNPDPVISFQRRKPSKSKLRRVKAHKEPEIGKLDV